MVLGLNLQVIRMQLTVFTLICCAMLITGYILAPYFLTGQRDLAVNHSIVFDNFIITSVNILNGLPQGSVLRRF